MIISIKKFEELTTSELYAILQLRSEVFVVEQDCVYQDLDGKDQQALHVIGVKQNQLVAYTRIFAPGIYFREASIGRVVVATSERKHGYGQLIMKASIEAIKTHFNTDTVRLSGQVYLTRFYNSLGFETIGEGYLEDGIPHIGMLKK